MQCSPVSEPKVINVPLFILEPMLPMSVGPAWRTKNLVVREDHRHNPRRLWLVSVLDLDNAVRFSRDTKEKTEETVFNIASPEGGLTEIIPLLRAIKQC